MPPPSSKPLADDASHSVEAETAACRELLAGQAALLQLLDPEDFQDRTLRRVSEVSREVSTRGGVDFLSISDAAARDAHLTEMGGSAFLAGLCDRTFHGSTESIVRVLKRHRAVREGAKLLKEAQTQPVEGLPGYLSEQGRRLSELLPKEAEADRATLLAELADDPLRVPTGLAQLDEFLKGGMQAGRLYVLGARPSCGRSTLAVNIAMNVLQQGRSFHFFSLEMERREILTRVICYRMGWREEEAVQRAAEGLPEEINFTITSLSTQIDVLAGQILASPHDLIVLDYFQLIESRSQEQRTFQLEEISRKLKLLTLETHKPILLLSQLSRDMEKAGREPQLSDLRGSGALEQDCDVAMFLHDPAMTGGSEGRKAAEIAGNLAGRRDVQLIVRKNRSGACGYVDLTFEPETFTMRERAV